MDFWEDEQCRKQKAIECFNDLVTLCNDLNLISVEREMVTIHTITMGIMRNVKALGKLVNLNNNVSLPCEA